MTDVKVSVSVGNSHLERLDEVSPGRGGGRHEGAAPGARDRRAHGFDRRGQSSTACARSPVSSTSKRSGMYGSRRRTAGSNKRRRSGEGMERVQADCVRSA